MISAASDAREREASVAVKHKVKVLLIDNSEESLAAHTRALGELGEELVCARTGREGLAHLANDQFAAVLLDIDLPDTDGFAIAELIRSREATRNTPIVFLTARMRADLVERAYSLGAVDLLQKPTMPVVLRAKVAGFVELARKAQLLTRQREEIQRLNAVLERRVEKRTAKLQQREAEMSRLLANLPDIISRFDRDLRFLYISPAITRIGGLAPAHYIGKTHAEAGVPPDVSEYLENGLREIFRTGEIGHVEFALTGPDGVERRYLGIGVPERGPDGLLVSILTIVHDVTGQKIAEEARRALEHQLMLLIEASGALLASPDLPNVLRHILHTATRFIPADAYAVWRKQPSGGLWKLVTSQGLSDSYESTAYERGAAPGLSIPSEPVAIEDVETFPLVQHRREFHRAEGIRSMLTVPLAIHGEIGGTIVYYHRVPHRFTEAEIRLGQALGNLAAAALGTAELYERQTQLRGEAERAEDKATFLAEAGAVLSSSLEYGDTLARVAQAAVPVFADWCSVDVLEGGELRAVTVAHQDPAKVEFAREFRRKYPRGEKDPGSAALRTGKSILVEELPDELIVQGARSPEHLSDIRRLAITSFIIAPMLAGARAVGTLTFVSAESGRRYTRADLAFAEELAMRAGHAIENARLHAEVRTSEERFRTMADSAPVLIWLSGPDKARTWFNKTWLDFTGRTMDQEVGNGWTSRVHPDDLDRVLDVYGSAFEARQRFEYEYRVCRHDGACRWVLAHGTPILDGQGNLNGYIGTCFDITERKESEEQLRRTNAELEQYAFAASHDLQEPLRTIKVYAQMLRRSYGDGFDASATQFLDFIEGGADRMIALVQDLLSYSRVIMDDACPEQAPVDMNAALDTALAQLKGALDERLAEVRREPLAPACGRFHDVVAVFQNLIGNAIKYAKAGEQPRICIRSCAGPAGFQTYSVEDNGEGIAPEYHDRVFRVFKRLHGREIEGTGIGLALCKRTVENHGGRIWVESRAGNGATFFFTLPAADSTRSGV
jgi:PAS domain S-box-containing protein